MNNGYYSNNSGKKKNPQSSSSKSTKRNSQANISKTTKSTKKKNSGINSGTQTRINSGTQIINHSGTQIINHSGSQPGTHSGTQIINHSGTQTGINSGTKKKNRYSNIKNKTLKELEFEMFAENIPYEIIEKKEYFKRKGLEMQYLLKLKINLKNALDILVPKKIISNNLNTNINIGGGIFGNRNHRIKKFIIHKSFIHLLLNF